MFDQRPLSVVAWVVNENGEFRLPAQVLEKVPHAVTAQRASDFNVDGTLQVQSITTPNGLLDVHVGDVIPEDPQSGGGLKIRGGGTGGLLIARNETYLEGSEGQTIRTGGGRISFTGIKF